MTTWAPAVLIKKGKILLGLMEILIEGLRLTDYEGNLVEDSSDSWSQFPIKITLTSEDLSDV